MVLVGEILKLSEHQSIYLFQSVVEGCDLQRDYLNEDAKYKSIFVEYYDFC